MPCPLITHDQETFWEWMTTLSVGTRDTVFLHLGLPSSRQCVRFVDRLSQSYTVWYSLSANNVHYDGYLG
jgi:hypothetical protein